MLTDIKNSVSAISIVRLVVTIQTNTATDVTYEFGNSLKWRYVLGSSSYRRPVCLTNACCVVSWNHGRAFSVLAYPFSNRLLCGTSPNFSYLGVQQEGPRGKPSPPAPAQTHKENAKTSAQVMSHLARSGRIQSRPLLSYHK